MFSRGWLDKHPDQLRAAVVTFLRLLEDHNHLSLASLKQREVTFVVSLIRERFGECMSIGRDFVRLLQNVARIPQIELLWRDILHNPRSLCQTFTGMQKMGSPYNFPSVDKFQCSCKLTYGKSFFRYSPTHAYKNREDDASLPPHTGYGQQNKLSSS